MGRERMDYVELKQKVRELAAKRKCVILVHNYQRPEIQDLADFVMSDGEPVAGRVVGEIASGIRGKVGTALRLPLGLH